MALASNNPGRLICHETKKPKQTKQIHSLKKCVEAFWYELMACDQVKPTISSNFEPHWLSYTVIYRFMRSFLIVIPSDDFFLIFFVFDLVNSSSSSSSSSSHAFCSDSLDSLLLSFPNGYLSRKSSCRHLVFALVILNFRNHCKSR